MSLKGKTLFITGGSRGIGLAIALRAAKDGANIVIAAKTAEEHPKLPGTIYSAAKEIEAAGGKCLPLQVDIRFEDQVKKAVDEAVKKFGGIDILINNASAISVSGTMDTPAKKFDLMMGINVRGTYIVSRECLPHLVKSSNPHILTLSPPLSMDGKWFKDHVAYTISKYGMSMCVLGMAEEFREQGVAANGLWPKTTIWTAAMKMLGGEEAAKGCRTTDIMSDAAYLILTSPSRKLTGQFLVDEYFLRQHGVTNFEKYACVPGAPLTIDIFVEEEESEPARRSKL